MSVQPPIEDFPEKITPFLKRKMEEIETDKGRESKEFQGLYLQYVKQDAENIKSDEDNKKHYEAGLEVKLDGDVLNGVERLYRRSMVIEPTVACVANCRHCLRSNYGAFTLNDHELKAIAKYCGSDEQKNNLNEVLITGGDPLTASQKLKSLVEYIMEYAPNVKTFRIATRLITQNPSRIDNNVFEIFKNKPSVRFELATQINHPIEFFPESVEKIKEFLELGVRVYSQNVLLKGVNDDAETLISLYSKMREYGIEAHYLFHCIPMQGIHHLRTSVEKGIGLIRELVNSGAISGRVKPMYALMTDIGKITLYEDVIINRDEKNRILLQSAYKYDDRMKWNPNWKLPDTAEVDENGYLRVWYLDGSSE